MKMKMFRLSKLVVVAFLVGLASSVSHAQSFDFEKYPKLDFRFNELDLDLIINPENRSIRGEAEYKLQANIAGADSLVLQAAHMEITSVFINDSNADYHLRNDSLIVDLADSSEVGESIEVTVEYETIPKFGVLSDDRATVWSSMLPRSNRHWFPGIDHPRVTFNSTIHLTVPSGYQAVASGVRIEEEILDVDNVRYTFKTRSKVPATSLAFAVGAFDNQEASFGIKKISLNTERGILSDTESNDLLAEAGDVLEESENVLNREFPYERLHIVVLQDHFWEAKTWGASTVFLYKNNGDLTAQLRRAIYAQWFGVMQREEQWSDAQAMNLLQTALHYSLEDTPAMIRNNNDIPDNEIPAKYDTFGTENWNSFQLNYDSLSSGFKRTIAQSLAALLSQGEGVYGFRDYGEYWYEQTGQPVFDLNLPDYLHSQDRSTDADSVQYRVEYNERASGLRLTFTAEQGSYDELVTLPLVQITSERTDTLEVTFTGAKDSVNIQVPALTENVKIISSSRPKLVLDEFKPAAYLIYQLRNAETVDERIEAAEKLGYHSNDPDLQFAIKEFLDQETNPKVKAALLSSFGDITNGASGTETVFLDAVRNENKDIQLAGLYVLQKYKDNEQVEEVVRNYTIQADSIPVFKSAARILSSMADSSEYEAFVSEVVRTDTAGHKAIFAIQVLANTGDIDKAVRQAEFYISDVYEYDIRSAALRILIQHDRDAGSWETRVNELLADPDPRIRFLTVKGLSNIDGFSYIDMLETIMQDEYDERVFKAMEQALNTD